MTMRRVLLITADYPPKLTSASRRPSGLSKYLPESGWKTVVLTIREKQRRGTYHGIELLESNLLSKPAFVKRLLDFIHKKNRASANNTNEATSALPFQDQYRENHLITTIRNLLFYPDRYLISWYRVAVKTYLQNARNLPIHAIISTAKPMTTHLIARRIKKAINVPWIADFRDLWPHWRFYQNDDHYYSAMNLINRLFVKWTLATADSLVTVSPPLSSSLRKRFKHKTILCIPNGFDPEEYAHQIPPDNSYFLLTYTGHVRTDRQDPEILLKAISELILERLLPRNQIRIRFYGEITSKLLKDIHHYQLSDIVIADGIRLSRDEIVVKQFESSLLIALAALDHDNIGTPSGKIYEYLAAKRPILAIGKPFGHDVLEDILKATRAGTYARTLDATKKTIVLYYNQFITKDKLKYRGFAKKINQYSHRSMAQQYADLLNHHIVF